MRHLRREMQIVFQNPYGLLDARQTIGSAIIEPMNIHGLGEDNGQRRSRTANREEIYSSPQKPYTQQLIAAISETKLEDIRQRQTVVTGATK